MAEYQAHIIENGKQRMASVSTILDEKPGVIAEEIIYSKNVRDGAKVLMSTLMFDYPSQTFKAHSFTFDVVDGRADNLTVVK